jgi:peroxiredoxin
VPHELLMLADGNGSFTRSLGLELDGSAYGMGLRAKRFALYAEDGVVKAIHVEAPGEFRVSTAEAMLEAIR